MSNPPNDADRRTLSRVAPLLMDYLRQRSLSGPDNKTPKYGDQHGNASQVGSGRHCRREKVLLLAVVGTRNEPGVRTSVCHKMRTGRVSTLRCTTRKSRISFASNKAMYWLNQAYDARFNPSILIRPGFDPLRSDLRLVELQQRMGQRDLLVSLRRDRR